MLLQNPNHLNPPALPTSSSCCGRAVPGTTFGVEPAPLITSSMAATDDFVFFPLFSPFCHSDVLFSSFSARHGSGPWLPPATCFYRSPKLPDGTWPPYFVFFFFLFPLLPFRRAFFQFLSKAWQWPMAAASYLFLPQFETAGWHLAI